jgi:type IX secretion system PorP/SprF family membrane protein
MRLRKIGYIIFVLLLMAGMHGYGQQDPMFTQYMNNPVLINPAYAGSLGALNVNGIFRKQWVGFEWSPTTTSFSVNMPFWDYRVGVGITFLHDKIGPLEQTGMYFDYAYHLDFDNRSRLSMGLKAGFNYYQKDLRGLTTYEYDSWIQNLPQSTKFLFNTGVGLFYYTDTYFLGASIPKLLRNSLSDYEDTYELVGKEERHYFFTGGGVIDINTIVKFKPTGMLRYVYGAPLSVEATATMIVFDRVWFGMFYRVGDSFGAHARVEVQEGYQIGYSYDLANSRLKGYNSGTHEVFISLTFAQKGRRILSPRYF